MQRHPPILAFNLPRFAIRLCAACCMAVLLVGCNRSHHRQIAVIPRTAGRDLWDTMLVGAESAARAQNYGIYWNAPEREDDVQGQIDLVERAISKEYDGIVLSPDQSLALIMPVRRALAKKIPVVVVGSPLPLPPGGGLAYVLNDEQKGGQLAAERAALLLRDDGTVAILGIDPDITGVMNRTRSFEAVLAEHYPKIRVVAKRMGAFNDAHEQEAADETLDAHPFLGVIVAMTSAATRGAYAALANRNDLGKVKIIGFDQDLLAPLENGDIDSIVIQDTNAMGRDAIEWIAGRRKGRSMPDMVLIEPVLATRQNFLSPGLRRMISGYWRPRN